MAKEAVLSFRVLDDTKEAVTRAAAAQDRSVSWLVERILREWLTKHGHIKRGAAEQKANEEDQ